jgi:hypothetical protein
LAGAGRQRLSHCATAQAVTDFGYFSTLQQQQQLPCWSRAFENMSQQTNRVQAAGLQDFPLQLQA